MPLSAYLCLRQPWYPAHHIPHLIPWSNITPYPGKDLPLINSAVTAKPDGTFLVTSRSHRIFRTVQGQEPQLGRRGRWHLTSTPSLTLPTATSNCILMTPTPTPVLTTSNSTSKPLFPWLCGPAKLVFPGEELRYERRAILQPALRSTLSREGLNDDNDTLSDPDLA